jgi:hypothetical protein
MESMDPSAADPEGGIQYGSQFSEESGKSVGSHASRFASN